LLAPLLCLALGCGGSGNQAPPPDAAADTAPESATELPSEVPEAADACPCMCQLPRGSAFRFTSMVCVPPGEAQGEEAKRYKVLCDMLNSIWKRDIAAHQQNIVYEIRDVTQCQGGAGTLGIELGSAGKRLASGAPCPLGETLTCDGRFHLLDDHAPFEAVIDGCTYASQRPEGFSLGYHPGDSAAPVLCGPDNTPPDGITFTQLQSSGRFDPACQQVTDGRLAGCISMAAATRLCLCNDSTYEKCPRNPQASGSYCQSSCGAEWTINFGGFVATLVGLPLNCDLNGDGTLDQGPDSPDGWWIHGTFEAERLPEAAYSPLP
jgi:hypothetical protein